LPGEATVIRQRSRDVAERLFNVESVGLQNYAALYEEIFEGHSG
jgi:hypothetical protein